MVSDNPERSDAASGKDVLNLLLPSLLWALVSDLRNCPIIYLETSFHLEFVAELAF